MKKILNSIILFALLFFINNISVFAEDYCIYQLQYRHPDTMGNYGELHNATFVAKWEGKNFVFVNYNPNGSDYETNKITKYIYDSLISNPNSPDWLIKEGYGSCSGYFDGCSVFYPDMYYYGSEKTATFTFVNGLGNSSGNNQIVAYADLNVASTFTSECPDLYYNITNIDTKKYSATMTIIDNNQVFYNDNTDNAIKLINYKTSDGATSDKPNENPSDDPNTGDVSELSCDKVTLNFGKEAIDQTSIGNFSVQFLRDVDNTWHMRVEGSNLDTNFFQETNSFKETVQVQFEKETLKNGVGCSDSRCIITLGTSKYVVIIEKKAWLTMEPYNSNSCPTYSTNMFVNQYNKYFLIEKDYRKPTDEDFFEDIVINYEFPDLIKSYIYPLQAYKKDVPLGELQISINGVYKRLSEITPTNDICDKSECSIVDYNTIRETLDQYCSIENVNKLSSQPNHENMKADCASYILLLKDLKEDVTDFYVGYGEGCEFITSELKDKLNMFLNIFKIAGPVLAIVLGMLDFAKVIFNEDADKQTKEAWKRFKTRIIAAAMLFLVPMLLSMLLNIFIGDQINNNPYCGLLDTEEKS